MKTAIAYYSQHHGNTKKLLDAIKAADENVTLIDVTEKPEVDLNGYDRIGFASGIYYSSFAKQVLNFARVNLPVQRDVFLIATCGAPRKNYFNAIRQVIKDKDCKEIGSHLCLGFDTFGPFKLVGGIQKGHPTEEEVQAAVEFYRGLS